MAGQSVEILGVTGALHLDAGGGGLDVVEIVGGQLDLDGSEVLLQSFELAGAGDGDDPRPLCQQPSPGLLRIRRSSSRWVDGRRGVCAVVVRVTGTTVHVELATERTRSAAYAFGDAASW